MKFLITNNKVQINHKSQNQKPKRFGTWRLRFDICLVLVICHLGFTLLSPLPSYTQSKWYKYPGNPVIVPGDERVPGKKGYISEVIYEDGVYKMWFFEWAYTSVIEDMRYATSTDGIHWQISDSNQLRFEYEGEPWDFRLGYFDILKIDSLYYMWYSTRDTSTWVVGYARSSDGLNWKKYPEPVFRRAVLPRVIFDGHIFYLWYGWGGTCLATSRDGINWERYPDNPVFTSGEEGDWDSYQVLVFSINYDGYSFEMWYIGSNLVQQQIGYAVSPDGIHWTRSPENPVVKNGRLGEWDCHYFMNASVIKQDSIYRMLYLATDNVTNGFGYATTSVEEALSWEQEGITKAERYINVRVFNRSETINVDSLEGVIPDLSGKQLVDAYNNLALAYSLNDDDKSFYYADKALQLAQQLHYPEGMAMAYYSRGNCQYIMDNYADALSNQLSALRIYDSLENLVDKGHLLSQIASIQAYTGSYELACSYHEQALKIFEDIRDTNFIINALNYLGDAHRLNQDTVNALKAFKRRHSFIEKTGNDLELATNYLSLGRCYTGREFDSALYFFNEARSIREKYIHLLEGSILLKDYSLLMAEAYFAAGPEYYEEAEAAFKSSYKGVGGFEHNQLIVRVQYGLAALYYKTDRFTEALQLLDRALSRCNTVLPKLDFIDYTSLNEKLRDEVNLKSDKEKIYRLYYLIHDTLNNKDLAFDYYQKASEWHDSIFDQQNRRQWAMLQGQYETERAESKISVLETENEMKGMQVRQTRIYLFVLAVVIVLIIMMGVLFFRQNKIKTEHRTVLLEQRLLRVQMNPHFIFNALAGLQAYIWKKDPKTANEYLASFSKLLRSILENSRQEFVPVEKEIETITHYLKLQSYLHKDKFDYHVVVDEAIDEEYMQIPPMLAQPFIENSIEHGISAKETKGQIEVRFSREADVIHVEVKDDGVGFRVSAEKKKQRAHESLAMKITMDRLSMLSKKYHQKYRFLASDVMDAENNITGARVSFDVPYTQI
jgi:predicted GH43/DUF377 family glycosyl hydrolase